MEKKNYFTYATFGDIVYSMCVMRMIGPGDLYVRLHYHDEFAKTVLGWPDAGAASGRLTQKDYDIVAPLLEAQDFIGKVAVWNGEVDDCPQLMDHWKMHLIKGWQGNQTECYALTQGWDIHDPVLSKKLLLEPWLTPVEPVKIKDKPVVINRTERYLYGCDGEQWRTWINQGLGDYAVFVGTEQEHSNFQKDFNVKVDYQPVRNLLEMAQVIQGSEQFMGNQSVALSIAIGLGKTFWCETRKDFHLTKTPHGRGDVWFPRINGHYF
jgi:hypothetical protein